ncbi:zinc finger domain-containing protein [Micromonospora coxensis]|uniref:zinc finger domain-containing protein n=1 Tax=Micromonospora coxensis TaxID=356852 RepID=UPI003F5757D7
MPRDEEKRGIEAVREIHKAATRYGDEDLHRAAKEISQIARELGNDPGPVQDWRPCPVCGAEPGRLCIRVPGHERINGVHPERNVE